MQLEDYFDFLAPDDIRIKGSRIGIETILLYFLEEGWTPEYIASQFRTITLEEVYATILYYLHTQPAVQAYLDDYVEYCRKSEEEALKNPTPLQRKLQQLFAEHETAKSRREAKTA